MKLSNSQFEQNARKTLSTIGSLDKALQMTGATKGFQSVSDAANKTDLGPIGRAVDTIAGKFNALTVIGYTALANLTTRAIDAGISIAKSLAIDPVLEGFSEYETKIGSIQTILANTSQYGTKLPEVNKNLEALNEYADKTIYNFGDMTRNIGLFTNAGLKVGEATQMIKGFSNVAAASGTTAGAAAGAAYQLSQALNSGIIRAMDWNSLTNAGMGGANMRRDLVALGKAMGTFGDDTKLAKLAGQDFKRSLEGNWLTAEVMSKYLQIMATDYKEMTKAQRKAAVAKLEDIGLTEKQAKAMIKYQILAQESATKVRTFSQLTGTIRENIGSGWAATAEIIIGDFAQATKLFTTINDYVAKNVDRWTKARNDTLKAWKKDGGRAALLEGLANGWKALLSVLGPIKEAFQEIFPPKTGKQLADMTRSFRDFMKGLILGKENMENLKSTFKGLFAILNVGWSIVKFTFTTLSQLFGIAQNGGGSFLALTGAIGEFLVKVQDWLVSSKQIGKWFSTINTARLLIVVPLVNILSKLGEALAALFRGDLPAAGEALKEAFAGIGPLLQGVWLKASADVRSFVGRLRDGAGVAAEFVKGLGIDALEGFGEGLEVVANWLKDFRTEITNFGMGAFTAATDAGTSTLEKFTSAGESAKNFWQGFRDGLGTAAEWFGPLADELGEWFSLINEKLQEYISGLDINDVIALLNTAFFIQMYRTIKGFVEGLKEMTGGFNDFGGHLKGVLTTIKGDLSDTMKTMQNSIKSDIVLKIAAAIAILAASLWVLSTIEPARLAAGVGAIAVLMLGMKIMVGSLLGMMEEVEGKSIASSGKILAAGGAILLLSLGILVLSNAVKNLAQLSWEEMAKGLIGVGVLLGALTLFTKFGELDKGGFKSGAGLLIMAAGVYVLAQAVKTLAELDFADLLQGAIAVQWLTESLARAADRMGSADSIKGAAGMLLIAGALAVLTPTIVVLGRLPLENLAKGLGTIGLAMAIFVIATQKMGDQKSLKGAGGILLMAAAIAVLAPALALLGFLPYETLGKGLVTVGLAMAIFAASTKIMGNPQSLAGAAGILLMAFALQQLAPVILLLGQADWGTLATGLGAFAIAMTIFMLAGLAAMYVGPGLLMIGAAIIMIGAGAMAAGIGMALFAAGLATLATIGTAGFAVITAAIIGFLNLIPLMAQQVGLGIRAIAVVISESGPQFTAALATLGASALSALDKLAPKFFKSMEKLIIGMIDTITRMIPVIALKFYVMIYKLLTVIQTMIPLIARKATDVAIAFINAWADNTPRLVDAGAKAIIKFINGLADAIDNNSEEMGQAGGRLAVSIVQGIAKGITGGIGQVVEAAKGLASSALNAAKDFLGIKSPSREFAKLGKYSAQGFAKGLKAGTRTEIREAMKALRAELAATYKSTAEDEKQALAKLKKLREEGKTNTAAYAQATKDLARARAEHAKVVRAQRLVKTWADEQKKLEKLANAYQKVTTKLDNAKKALSDAKKERDDYAKSVTDQFNKLPDFDKDTKLDDFVANLEKQVADTQILNAQLEKLRELGLNDASYKALIAKGVDAIPFAQQILEGGQVAIDQINELEAALATSSKEMGDETSAALYQAGVNIAQGLVNGLIKEQTALDKQMDRLADRMVSTLKSRLGIKSPSRVFAEQGAWSVKGLAHGLEATSKVSEKAAAQVGLDTIESLRKTLSGLSETALEGVDLDPVIRPVMDLSQLQSDAVKMEGLLGGNGVSVGAQLSRALILASERSALAASGQEGTGDSITFNQYNNSPEALSDATIYRQTKNQLSTVKGALNT